MPNSSESFAPLDQIWRIVCTIGFIEVVANCWSSSESFAPLDQTWPCCLRLKFHIFAIETCTALSTWQSRWFELELNCVIDTRTTVNFE